MSFGIQFLGDNVKSSVSALIEILREDVVRALEEARARFLVADAALKAFRFSYPAKPEEFEEWKRLGDIWDERDEEVQAAREALKDFDQGKFAAPRE